MTTKPRSKTRFQRSKVSNLYVDNLTGIYFARAKNNIGRDVWRSLSTSSFSVAREKLPAMLANIRGGSGEERTRTRDLSDFDQVATIYRERIQSDTSLKPSAKKYRLDTINGLFRSWPELSTMPARMVTLDGCLAWAAQYRDRVHGTRFNNTIDTLRHTLAIAKERGLITANPAEQIGKAKVTPKRLSLPTREQFHAIVLAIRNSGAWCAQDCGNLIEFLAYSGARITEAANVRWQDVDGKTGTIRIHGDETHGTKNSESRSVPITPPMRDLLDRMSTRTGSPRRRDRRDYVLFVTEAREALANACRKVGAHRISHHDLRHLFATRCIEAGVDVPTVARWLGHRDGGALAMRIYGHLRDEHSQAMAQKVVF
jgi:integrase